MLVVISPAKRLDWQERSAEMSAPEFQDDAVRLARTARNLTLGNLKSLMGLSDDLARLNRDRFAAFADAPEPEATRPAALAFAGDTYQGLQAESLSDEDLDWARERLGILSGLYGVLRPLDAIQPYRLEMGSRLKTRRGGNLYDYWRDGPAKALNARAEATGATALINCASQEYFGAVDLKTLTLPVVTPQFLERKDGTAKIISFYAKRARGSMARYVVQNRLTRPEQIETFDTDGYAFSPELSEPGKPAFVRDARAK